MNKSNQTERHLSNTFKVNYILLLLFILSGCSKDDNPDKELSRAIKEVVGTYKGELNSKELPKEKYANAIVFVEKVDD
ncbi:hypothetical protein [Sphingobacterium yanglingense]|uniref:Uncharacterized protein n=1 Tax=Sphingobacterium yanglingense TaxID=1437280 RepID=A0A4R6W594_9SPHI|nr:hypothetical protein [Sphingobacterium yanglingense]TDQ73928.1 hypothetical protein CLV99_4366 [Sphingobacterium yanglingense]